MKKLFPLVLGTTLLISAAANAGDLQIRVKSDKNERSFFLCPVEAQTTDNCEMLGERSYHAAEIEELVKDERFQATGAKVATGVVAVALIGAAVAMFNKRVPLELKTKIGLPFAPLMLPAMLIFKSEAAIIPAAILSAGSEIAGLGLFAKYQDEQADVIEAVLAGKNFDQKSVMKTAKTLDKVLRHI